MPPRYAALRGQVADQGGTRRVKPRHLEATAREAGHAQFMGDKVIAVGNDAGVFVRCREVNPESAVVGDGLRLHGFDLRFGNALGADSRNLLPARIAIGFAEASVVAQRIGGQAVACFQRIQIQVNLDMCWDGGASIRVHAWIPFIGSVVVAGILAQGGLVLAQIRPCCLHGVPHHMAGALTHPALKDTPCPAPRSSKKETPTGRRSRHWWGCDLKLGSEPRVRDSEVCGVDHGLALLFCQDHGHFP